MKKFFIGQSPLTTISGYILSALFAIRDLNTSGSHDWKDCLLPLAIALFGRLTADEKNRKKPEPAMPSILPDEAEQHDDGATTEKPDTFLRRGKAHKQSRARNGRFANLVLG